MDNIRVSVIMPVYNSKQYLETAIKSVLNQEFEGLELLLADDGSTDGSGDICDKYASDQRVRVFHKTNEGICATRNFAVNHARGEYVVFIDNDDELVPGVLKKNYDLAERYHADVVKYGCSIEESFPDGYVDRRANVFKELCVFTKEESGRFYAAADRDRYFSYIWNGMYRRNWWIENKMEFNISIRCGYEDRVLNYKIFCEAGVQVLNPEIGYRYFQRYDHSTFKKFNRNMLYSCLLSAEAEHSLYQHYKDDKDFHSSWHKKAAEYLTEFLMLLSRADNDMTIEEIVQFMKKIRRNKAFADLIREQSGQELSLTKKGVTRLFAAGRYETLYKISRLYARFIFLKKRLKKHEGSGLK